MAFVSTTCTVLEAFNQTWLQWVTMDTMSEDIFGGQNHEVEYY
jgi:hypothetical protein